MMRLAARAIQASGFSIAGTTGYGMHGVVLGQPDTGLLALNETVSILSKMVDAVDIPILADAREVTEAPSMYPRSKRV